jgi:hypothetical protein
MTGIFNWHRSSCLTGMPLSYIGERVNAKSLEKELNKNFYELFIQARD